MVDITRLNYFVAGFDPNGRAVLQPKPLPPEYADASPVSKRAYEFAAKRELETIGMAARQEALRAARPSNWGRANPVDRLAWEREAARLLAKGELGNG